MPPKEKVVYTESTAALDLKRRLENDNESALQVAAAATTADPYGKDEKGKENGYVNVDQVYQNYADDTHKPLAAEDGVQKDAEEAFREAVAVDEDDDRSSDQKPSGAYVDSEDQRLGATPPAAVEDKPFGDSGNDGVSDTGVAKGNENQ